MAQQGQGDPAQAPGGRAGLDAALVDLQTAKDRWVRVPVARRIALLEQLKDSTQAAARDWVEISARQKNVAPAARPGARNG